jgi:hypothetical protein
MMCEAEKIFERYKRAYDGEVQGLCPVIADEIQRAIGGDVVAGYLHFFTNQRSHWWVEKDGVTFDPMGEWALGGEPGFRREIVHRDRNTFEAILPQYEQWRLA